MKKLLSSLLLVFIISYISLAQERWNLERCIRYAQETNLSMQQSQITLRNAKLDAQQAKANRLPNVSANSNAGIQLGRTIDPVTNSFNTSSSNFNSMSLDIGMNLFQGGLLHYTVKQSETNQLAAKADLEHFANTLALQVAQAYLNILLADEQVLNANNRLNISKEQLENTKRFIQVGTLPAVDSLNILAQIARDEQQKVTANNTVELAYLNLKQILQLEPDFKLVIEKPNMDISNTALAENLILKNIYNASVGTQPNIRANEFRIESARTGVQIAKSGYYPRLSMFASLSSNYSSRYIEPLKDITVQLGDPRPVNFNGIDGALSFYEPVYQTRTVPYGRQLNDNFGQSFGLQLQVPIYQNSRNKINVERAELNIKNAELQTNQAKNQLKSDIQTAIANAKAAKLQLDAAQLSFKAMQAVFQNTEKRHKLGAVNTMELTTARNNLDIAENEFTIARYDYIFKLKILDFYLGKKISLN